MKLTSTRIVFTFLFIVFSSLKSNSQDKYNFSGSSLVSGTALSVGAVYKFTNVKSGVDATVRVEAITGGLTLTTIDGTGGFVEALQPTISVPPYSTGYVELLITFLVSGTATPSIQPEIPITPIDVDGQKYGGLPLYEFDEIQVTSGYTYFQYAGSELNMTLNGTWARGKNKVSIDYPGIDTAQKQVMFTTVNPSVTSIRVRVGADNTSGSTASRLRSLYFQKFNYPYTYVLEKEPSITFEGIIRNSMAELHGTITDAQQYNVQTVERSIDGIRFTEIGNLSVTENNTTRYFSFFDATIPVGKIYYRIKLVNTVSKSEKFSSIFVLQNSNDQKREMTLINTIVNKYNPVLIIDSKNEETADISILDFNGQIKNHFPANFHTGTNRVIIPGTILKSGYFVIVIRKKSGNKSYKFIVQ